MRIRTRRGGGDRIQWAPHESRNDGAEQRVGAAVVGAYQPPAAVRRAGPSVGIQEVQRSFLFVRRCQCLRLLGCSFIYIGQQLSIVAAMEKWTPQEVKDWLLSLKVCPPKLIRIYPG